MVPSILAKMTHSESYLEFTDQKLWVKLPISQLPKLEAAKGGV